MTRIKSITSVLILVLLALIVSNAHQSGSIEETGFQQIQQNPNNQNLPIDSNQASFLIDEESSRTIQDDEGKGKKHLTILSEAEVTSIEQENSDGTHITDDSATVQKNHTAIDGQHTGETTQEQHQTSHFHSPSEPQFWYNCLLSLVLTVTGAFCSGMTVGLCNLDTLQLQVMSMGKDQKEKHMANRILAVVSNHHLFLVTLLVYNAIALESLPLVVHTLMPAWAAILFSTVIVLVVAQIVPQAICTGPKQMILAYYAAPVISVMTKVMCFIIYPMAKGLDALLGVHNHHRIQHKDFATFLTGNKVLKKTQKMLLTSTLQLRTQRVQEKMIPLKKLYMIDVSQPLTENKVQQIYKKDFSYILVYKDKRENIMGVIKVKQFAMKYLRGSNKTIKPEDVIDHNTNFLSVYKDTNLLEMLMLFQANSSRIALICDEKKKTDSTIPSIMYTKTDMLIKKKGANIIGAIFLYGIFDEISDFESHVPQTMKQPLQRELKEMKELNKPLLDN